MFIGLLIKYPLFLSEFNDFNYEIYEKNCRIHLDRLQNKYTNYKGMKTNINFGQITGVQRKMDTTCK
jgi:hypothetical protein